MRVEIEVDLACNPGREDAVFLILEAAETAGQTILESTLTGPGTTFSRRGPGVWATGGGPRFVLAYRAVVDVTRADLALDTPDDTPWQALPADVLPYLRPSRYCQSDLFTDFAGQVFGHLSGGAKMAAIRDWVAAELTYVSGVSHGATTAIETFASRQGVCRDYAHMVCTLARAAGVPARYVAVYAPRVSPPDFHAVAQVWLDGGWHMIDATAMCTASDAVVIATGRDAADVAFMETAGWSELHHQSVKVTVV